MAGGLGTRLSEETGTRPKPMVTVGGRPMLWHIMNIYASHGVRDFVIALGYRGEVVKEYLLNFKVMSSSFRVGTAEGSVEMLDESAVADWRVAAVDTGERTETGGRIKRAAAHVTDDLFLATYGDGVADVDISALIAYHRSHGKLATVTAVRPPARFGRLHLEGENGDMVTRFGEKPQSEEGWINGGFFVLDRKVLDYIRGDGDVFEREPLEAIAAEGQLMAYRHEGFWQPMDTLRERMLLEELWDSGKAPWKTW
nr:glucose-1-phosphate cytidylyltransferase [Motilibacter aurantiacus]